MPIIVNSYAVGKSWTLQTGNLVYMTSDNAPSPYVASMVTGKTGGNANEVFDSNDSSGVYANYFSPSTTGLGVQLLFGKNLRLSKFSVRGNRSGQANWTCSIYGIKEDDSLQLIYQGSVSVNSNTTVSSTDTTTEFKGVRVFIDTRSDLIVTLYRCLITEWYEYVQ